MTPPSTTTLSEFVRRRWEWLFLKQPDVPAGATVLVERGEATHYVRENFDDEFTRTWLFSKIADAIEKSEQNLIVVAASFNEPVVKISERAQNEALDLVASLQACYPETRISGVVFSPGEITPLRRLPWPTLTFVVERGLVDLGSALVEISMVDLDRGQLQVGDALPSIEVLTTDIDRPDVIVSEISTQLGWSVEPLRVSSRTRQEVASRCRIDLESDPALRWRPTSFHPTLEQRQRWQRPGWLDRLTTSVDDELGKHNIDRTSPIQVVRHSSVTCMAMCDSTEGRLWIKQAHDMFVSEPALFARFPADVAANVPRVIASTDEWFAMRDFGIASEETEDVLDTHFRTQWRLAEELSKGWNSDGFLRRPLNDPEAELSQVVDALPTEDDVLKTRLAPLLKHVAEQLSPIAAILPETIVHGDFGPANTWHSGDRWIIHDWTDASIGSPAVDIVSSLRAHGRLSNSLLADHLSRWTSRGEVTSAGVVKSAVVAAAAFQVLNYGRIVRHVDLTAADRSGGASLRFHLRKSTIELALELE